MLTLAFTQRLPYFSQCNKKVKMGDLFETQSKNPEETKSSYQCQVIKQEFETLSKTCSEGLETCRHQDGILTLTCLLKDSVAADRDGNWEDNLQGFLPFLNVR